MNSEPEIVADVRLFLNGYVYVRSKKVGNTTHWDCNRVRNGTCKARAHTVFVDGKLVVTQGPDVSKHSHVPNREEAESEKIKMSL